MDFDRNQLRDQHVRQAFNSYVKVKKKNYRIIKPISDRGAFSSVYEVHDENGKAIVMKAVDTEINDVDILVEDVIRYTNKEIESMKQCKDSPYVMDLIDSDDVILNQANNHHVFLIFMPKLKCATDYFFENGYKLNEILSMAKDICKALDYCHSKHILHRDVKPDNIYYSDELGHFILADFGISRTLFDFDCAVTTIGSYLAPEIKSYQDLKGRMNSDIYSLGISILILISQNTKNPQVVKKCLDSLNADIRAVVQHAIDGNPATRYQTAMEFYKAIESIEAKVQTSEVKYINKFYDCFMRKDYRSALKTAQNGYEKGLPISTCLYAYLLASQGKDNEALHVLEPLKRAGHVAATGLYGIIGRKITIKSRDYVKDGEMVKLIEKSANNGFSPALYYIGRWKIDGESGFSIDIESGLEYLFESCKRGFIPSMYYLRDTLRRNSQSFISIQSMLELIDIELEGFSKENFPEEMIRAIVVAY